MATRDQLVPLGERSLLDAVHRCVAQGFGMDREGSGQSRVAAAFRHHFETPGKQTRPTLAIEASRALGLDTNGAVGLAACIEALHNASLVQDDLQDGALERRGRPSAHSLFGKDVALGLATRLVSGAFVNLAEASRFFEPGFNTGDLFASMTQRVHSGISETVDGQSDDLDPGVDCSAESLSRIARQKSGPLFALALELPLMAAGHTAALDRAREAACRLGLGYQIMDDLKDQQVDRLQPADANIVNALAQRYGPAEARHRAVEMACAELFESAQLASELPASSGAYLAKMADDLLDRLRVCCE